LRILITGGSGLLALNWAVVTRSEHEVVLGLHSRKISLSDVYSKVLNLGSVEELAVHFDSVNPDLVVHTAGMTNVETCETNKELACYTNINLAVNVARVCRSQKRKLVHISTDHLFSGDSPNADESAEIKPQNVYAFTKAEAEKKVCENCPDALIVRTNFFGWGTSYRKSFSDVILESLRAGKEIFLFKDVFYTPILIETLVNSVHELINSGYMGIINIVGSDRITKYQFGLMLADCFRLDSSLIKPGLLREKTCLVKRPFDMSLSNKKLCRELGVPVHGVEYDLVRLREGESSEGIREIRSL